MRNIRIPNLPDSNVGLVLVKNDIRLIERLDSLGIDTLSPIRNPFIDAEVSEHPDMLCCMPDCGTVIVSPEQTELKKRLADYGFAVRVSEKQIAGEYPGDILLNFAVGPDFILGNIPCADKALIYGIKEKKAINVKQGYAKCSTCFVSESAFITEDTGIAKALSERGFDVLKISGGEVCLSERHTGFFGGATGKLSKDILAVNGSLSHHKDGDSIRKFLNRHGVEPLELFDGRIRDTGGIIPLKETSYEKSRGN